VATDGILAFHPLHAGMNYELIGSGMDDQKIRVLIVSLPGILQGMLKRVFASKPVVDVVDIANGALTAAKLIDDHLPDMAVIDSNLPESEAVELIRIMREHHPGIYSLALAETSHNLNRLTMAGADLVLRGPELASKLDDLLIELLARVNRKAS